MRRLLILSCVLAVAGIGGANAQVPQRYGTTGYGATTPYGSAATAYSSGSTTPYGSSLNSAGRNFTAPTSTSPVTTPPTTANSDYQRVMNAASGNDSSTDDDGSGQPVGSGPSGVAVPPGGGYANNLGQGYGTTTSPSGSVGLGTYNKSPYASGRTTAPTSTTAAPGPATPVYTGTAE